MLGGNKTRNWIIQYKKITMEKRLAHYHMIHTAFLLCFLFAFLGSSRQLVYIVRASCLYSLQSVAIKFFSVWRARMMQAYLEHPFPSASMRPHHLFVICSVAIKIFHLLIIIDTFYHIAIHYANCNQALLVFSYFLFILISMPCVLFMMTSRFDIINRKTHDYFSATKFHEML